MVGPVEVECFEQSLYCRCEQFTEYWSLYYFYRFGGGEFPPMIFFKVFLHSDGKGVKYMSGKRVIKPATGVCGF